MCRTGVVLKPFLESAEVFTYNEEYHTIIHQKINGDIEIFSLEFERTSNIQGDAKVGIQWSKGEKRITFTYSNYLPSTHSSNRERTLMHTLEQRSLSASIS